MTNLNQGHRRFLKTTTSLDDRLTEETFTVLVISKADSQDAPDIPGAEG
jgi:hypothetical protein